MTVPQRRVIVVGRSTEKMIIATAVLESHGFASIGVFSEQEAHQAIAQPDELFAVVTGGSIDRPTEDRLRTAASSKGAVLITAHIGHGDPGAHFAKHVVPQLIEAWDRVPTEEVIDSRSTW